MNILFLGTIFNENNIDEILSNSKSSFNFASHLLQKDIVEGLDFNTSNNVKIINLLSVGRFPKHYKKLFFKTYHWSHNGVSKDLEIGSINLQPLKDIQRLIKLKFEIKKWINESDQNRYIVIYDVYPILLKAIQELSKNIKVILVVPDLPGENNFTGKSGFRSKIAKMRFLKINKLYLRIDGFVLISKYMSEIIPTKNKHVDIIECMINSDIKLHKINNSDKKVIFYGGSLHLEYGIMDLVNTFSEIDNQNYELVICGSGNSENLILEASKKDSRIIFKGLLNPEEFQMIMQSSDLLINPRNDSHTFTKYSFPSKTLFYMLTGIPVCMYKLAGIPDEYDEYLNYFDENEMKFKIVSILENLELYKKKSLDARKFVVDYKNNKVQTKKIIDMFLKM